MKFSLTDMEQKIMTRLWETQKWTTGAQFWDYFNSHGTPSKRQTVNTYLTRMMEKGLLVKNRTAYMYAYTKEEFEQKKAQDILDRMYGGSLKNFLSALSGTKNLSKQDKEDLRVFLDGPG